MSINRLCSFKRMQKEEKLLSLLSTTPKKGGWVVRCFCRFTYSIFLGKILLLDSQITRQIAKKWKRRANRVTGNTDPRYQKQLDRIASFKKTHASQIDASLRLNIYKIENQLAKYTPKFDVQIEKLPKFESAIIKKAYQEFKKDQDTFPQFLEKLAIFGTKESIQDCFELDLVKGIRAKRVDLYHFALLRAAKVCPHAFQFDIFVKLMPFEVPRRSFFMDCLTQFNEIKRSLSLKWDEKKSDDFSQVFVNLNIFLINFSGPSYDHLNVILIAKLRSLLFVNNQKTSLALKFSQYPEFDDFFDLLTKKHTPKSLVQLFEKNPQGLEISILTARGYKLHSPLKANEKKTLLHGLIKLKKFDIIAAFAKHYLPMDLVEAFKAEDDRGNSAFRMLQEAINDKTESARFLFGMGIRMHHVAKCDDKTRLECELEGDEGVERLKGVLQAGL